MHDRSQTAVMRRLTRSLGVLIALVGVVFVTRELTDSWNDVREAVAGSSLVSLLAALMVGSCAMLIIGLGWRRCLRVLGARLGVLEALRGYYVGQLGKYVPGGVWPVLGRGEMARRSGVARGPAYASTVMSLGVTYLAATLAAGLALAAGAAGGDRVAWQPVLALLPLGLLVLHPRMLGAALRAARRVSRRALEIPVPSWGVSAGLLVWHLPAWLAIGGATWLVALTLDPARPDLRNILFATVLSWVVGFLVVPAPGGIGVREAVFVAAATTLSSTGVAAAVAVTARVIFILVDLTGAGVTSLLSQVHPPARSTDDASRRGANP